MKPLLIAMSLLVCACGSDEPPPEQAAPEGRAETQSIRNAEAVGYSGNAIADKVDAGLQANEEQVRKAQREAEEQQ